MKNAPSLPKTFKELVNQEPNTNGIYYIGIDPGVNTGYAIWDKRAKVLRCVEKRMIHEVMIALSNDWNGNRDCIQVVIEEARHGWSSRDSHARSQGAGSVKRDCKIWEDFLKENEIPFRFVKPTKKSLTKLSAKEFQRITGWNGITNSHGRDAAMLVFGM